MPASCSRQPASCLFWGVGKWPHLRGFPGQSYKTEHYWKLNPDLVQSQWSISDQSVQVIELVTLYTRQRAVPVCVLLWSNPESSVIFFKYGHFYKHYLKRKFSHKQSSCDCSTYNYSQRLSLTGCLSPHTRRQNFSAGSTFQSHVSQTSTLFCSLGEGDWPCLSF